MPDASRIAGQRFATLWGAFAIGCLGYSLLGGLMVKAAPHGEAGVKTYRVTIEGLRFSPPVLAVTVGDRIVWINKDPFPHTVTADAKAFDSHDLAADSSWEYTPRRAGEYPYGCIYHQTMKATLLVRAKPQEGRT
jgi:plastocyanin